MAKKVTAPLTQHTPSAQKQRDRQRQSDSSSLAYPVSNSPVGAIMDNVSAAPTANSPVQAKLTIGEPGDKYEREADAMAAQVVSQLNQPGGLDRVAPKAEEPGSQTVQRLVTANGFGPANAEFESTLQSTLGKGHSLDSTLQAKLETAMNADFSGLTIHTDQTADVMCQSIGAQAFTTGSDIYFGQGEYQPSTPQGQFLITHEATHSMQQGAADVQCQSLSTPGSMVIQRTGGFTDSSALLSGQVPGGEGRTRASGNAAGRDRTGGGADRVVGGVSTPVRKAKPPLLDTVVAQLRKDNLDFSDLVRFSKGEFSAENPEFLQHCKFYYLNSRTNGVHNYDTMMFIFNNFVSPSGGNMINVSSGVRSQIAADIDAEHRRLTATGEQRTPLGIPGIFDDAQSEIARLTGDTISRLKASRTTEAESAREYVDARTGGNRPQKKGLGGVRAAGHIILGI